MENLTERENELRKLAESGDYWDILELSDFLYDQGKNEEAEEWYLKIAGEEDLSGDANAHYSHMLLDMENYDKAIEYFQYAMYYGMDTSPKEGILERFLGFLNNLDDKIWIETSQGWLKPIFIYTELNEIDVVEQILIKRCMKSNEKNRQDSMYELIWLYHVGDYYVGGDEEKVIGNIFEHKRRDKLLGTANFFAEQPSLIGRYDPYYDDDSFLRVVLQFIEEDFPEKAEEYVRQYFLAIIESAQKIGNIDEVCLEIHNDYDDGISDEPYYPKACVLGFVPEGLTWLPMFAFSYGCYWSLPGIVSVDLPDTIDTIGACAFQGCEALETVTLPKNLKIIGDYAFSGCGSLKSVVIPNSVSEIGHGAFWGCSSFTSITIPDSVTSIGGYAFCGCDLLTSIILPKGITSIGEYAFSECSSLKTIYCEAECKPDGWDKSWHNESNAEVIWGYKK